ncbi:MAG: hypothetical protein V4659_10505 [Pseudomonadota bacterium]
MRAILVLIGLAALVLVVLMSLGMVSLTTSPGKLPTLSGGQAPGVEANVGSIGLTTTNKTIEVPTVTTTEKTIAVPSLEVKQAAPAATPTPAQ